MQLLRRIPYYGFWTLLIYMPFHIFLSQSLSLTTGGLDAWKVGKDVVLAVLTLFTICLIWQQRRANRLFNWLVVLSAAYGILHVLLWALNPDIYARSAILGIMYNNRLPCFLLLGLGAHLLNPGKFAFSSVIKIVIGVSTVVACLGLLQYFLPGDVLTHFGYSLERGTRAAFYIDDNASLPRIMSTLREPNALGAYLLVPIAALTSLVCDNRHARRRLLLGALLALHLVTLLLTHSRSAWAAAVLVMALVLLLQYKDLVVRVVRQAWPLLIVGIVAVSVVGFMVRGSSFVEHYITHASEEAVVDLDSNDYHQLFIREGLEGVAAMPGGHGPGTAGLASIQNPAGGQLTENYYLQIAYEVGIVGLVLFAAINVIVYVRLRRNPNAATVVLLASFWGYVLTNMLLHTWSNEAVAAQWWLLAGVMLVSVASTSTKKRAVS